MDILKSRLPLLLMLLSMTLMGCGDDGEHPGLVGGECRDNRDCPPQWECEREALRGASGDAWVCKG